MTTAVTSLLLAVPVVSGAGVTSAPTAIEQTRVAAPSLATAGREEAAERRSRVGVGHAARTQGNASTPSASTPPGAGAAGTVSAPPATAAASRASSPASVSAGAQCAGPGRTTTRPHPTGAVLGSQWVAKAPAADVTYDLSGVTSTAYPATNAPFAVGTTTPAARTCLVGGTIQGSADDAQPWQVYHDQYNASCVKIIALEWMDVRGLRCDNLEDGIKPQESGVNANNARFTVSGTYLSRIRDDCMENDYTVGGLLHDSLWESCNTGISERPSAGRSWATPSAETLVLDHMLIGLYQTPHVEGGQVVMGENGLFKWSTSGNKVVIRCSTFKVNAVSLNGRDAMALPQGTVVDDSACPDHPSTIVWLGGGAYPAWTAGIRVVSDPGVWTSAVRTWKSAHGV